MSTSGRFLCCLVLAALVLPGGSQARDDDGPSAQALLDLAGAGRGDELASELEAVMQRPDWSLMERERVLYEFVTGVRRLPPEQVPVAQLETLTDYESRFLVAHPESRGALMLPRFDIAGAAAGSIEHAERRLRVAEYAGGLTADPAGFWSGASGGDPGALAPGLQEGIVSRVAPGALSASRESLMAAWQADPRLAPAMAGAATRLADEGLAQALLAKATGPHALKLVKRIPEVFPAPEAMALLTRAAGRPELASAAVMGLGRLAPQTPAARDWLLTQLDHPRRGASAAAALARLDDPAIVDKTARSLTPSKSQAGLRHRLLLLHLSGTPAARQALAAFAGDPAMPEGLRREVGQWR